MTQATDCLFWTMHDAPHYGQVTLCDPCALVGTNLACEVVGSEEKFDTMSEAATILNALSAIAGLEPNLSSATTGTCGHCGRSNL